MRANHLLLVEPNNNAYGEEALSRPLGGSETIFIFMVRALEKRDDIDLEVFYKDSGDFKEFVKDKNYDLVISYRSPEPLFQVQGKINAIYLQDLPNQQSVTLMNILFQQGKLNKLIFLSHFQKQMYLQHMPGVQEGRHCLMFENGLDLDLFDSSIDKENAFIYASAPNRGLDVLLDMWGDIHTELPEYTLKIAGSTTMYNVESNTPEMNQSREELLGIGDDMYDQDISGVEWLGGLSHAELIEEMEKCKALLYPSTFAETSCHVLNCALHAGAVPVISSVGAIIEKIGVGENGIVIPGDPHSKEFKKMYVEAVVDMIKSGRIDRMIAVNRGSYTAWGMDRLVDRLITQLLKFDEIEGLNQRVLGVVCSLYDRGENAKINFRNLIWYAPIDMITDEITGMPIDQARNAAASMTIHTNADWLLFLDSDVFVDKYFLTNMLKIADEHGVDVVVANYPYHEEELIPTARVVRVSDNRAINCYGIADEDLNDPEKYRFVTAGLGATLISVDALKRIGRPYFRTQNVHTRHTGEDAYFYQECRAVGVKVWLTVNMPIIHADSDKLYGQAEHIRLIRPQLGFNRFDAPRSAQLNNR